MVECTRLLESKHQLVALELSILLFITNIAPVLNSRLVVGTSAAQIGTKDRAAFSYRPSKVVSRNLVSYN